MWKLIVSAKTHFHKAAFPVKVVTWIWHARDSQIPYPASYHRQKLYKIDRQYLQVWIWEDHAKSNISSVVLLVYTYVLLHSVALCYVSVYTIMLVYTTRTDYALFFLILDHF